MMGSQADIETKTIANYRQNSNITMSIPHILV